MSEIHSSLSMWVCTSMTVGMRFLRARRYRRAGTGTTLDPKIGLRPWPCQLNCE
jgi:hypothetical protein